MLARHVEEDGGLRIPEGGGGKQVNLGKPKYLGLTLYPALEKIRLGALICSWH